MASDASIEWGGLGSRMTSFLAERMRLYDLVFFVEKDSCSVATTWLLSRVMVLQR